MPSRSSSKRESSSGAGSELLCSRLCSQLLDASGNAVLAVVQHHAAQRHVTRASSTTGCAVDAVHFS
jgi:hypothetical protein